MAEQTPESKLNGACWTVVDYLKYFEQTCCRLFGLTKKKNAGYRGVSDDPFRNFKSYGMAGVSVQQGIFTRMVDKMQRAGGLIERMTQPGAEDQPSTVQVNEVEPLHETLDDLIVYALLLKATLAGGAGTGVQNNDLKQGSTYQWPPLGTRVGESDQLFREL